MTVMCVASGILYLAAGLLSAILHIDTHDTGLDSRFTLLAETASAIGCLAGLWIVARVHKRVFPGASPQGIGLALKGHARELWAGIGVAGGLYAIGFLTVLLLGGAKVTDASVHLPALLQTLVFFFTVAVSASRQSRIYRLAFHQPVAGRHFAGVGIHLYTESVVCHCPALVLELASRPRAGF